MAFGKKPPLFAQQLPDGPIPLASFEEDLFDTASEATVSPESEDNSILPPLPCAKDDKAQNYSDHDNLSQDGTLTPKSFTGQSHDSLLSSRDELRSEEFGSNLASPKTPTIDARSPSPFAMLFKWRSSSPHGSPRKSPCETASSPVSSTPPKSPKSPRWKKDGKAFLSFFKLGDKKHKVPKNEAVLTKYVDAKPEVTEEPNVLVPQSVVADDPPPKEMMPELYFYQDILPETIEEDVEPEDGNEKSPVEGAMDVLSSDPDEHVEDKPILETDDEVDHETQNLLSQESLDGDDGIFDHIIPVVTKSEPMTPSRKQRLMVVTIPVERPRSRTLLSIAPLEAYISSGDDRKQAENVDKIKLKLPGDEFAVKERASSVPLPAKSWENFCESGLQSPRMKKRPNQAPKQQNDQFTFNSTETWANFDNFADVPKSEQCPVDWMKITDDFDPDVQFGLHLVCNCQCSKLPTSEIASMSFDDDRIEMCQCSCHFPGDQEIKECDCDCRILMSSLPAAITDCNCMCHATNAESVCNYDTSVTTGSNGQSPSPEAQIFNNGHNYS